MIQGLKRLVLWIQTLPLLEEQGLWIQAIVFHYSYAKAVSHMISMVNLAAIGVETLIIYSGPSLEKEFTKLICINP